MKKLFFAAVAVLSFAGANAQQNSVKVNPLALLGGSDLVSYEVKISDKTSGVVGVGYGGYKFGGFDYTSYGFEAQYRYYFEEAIKGWYGAGQAGYTLGEVKTDTNGFGFGDFGVKQQENKTTFGNIRIGAKAGYQFVWTSGFTLDLNLGIAYNKFTYKDNGGVFSTLNGSGVLPFGGLGLGYSF